MKYHTDDVSKVKIVIRNIFTCKHWNTNEYKLADQRIHSSNVQFVIFKKWPKSTQNKCQYNCHLYLFCLKREGAFKEGYGLSRRKKWPAFVEADRLVIASWNMTDSAWHNRQYLGGCATVAHPHIPALTPVCPPSCFGFSCNYQPPFMKTLKHHLYINQSSNSEKSKLFYLADDKKKNNSSIQILRPVIRNHTLILVVSCKKCNIFFCQNNLLSILNVGETHLSKQEEKGLYDTCLCQHPPPSLYRATHS